MLSYPLPFDEARRLRVLEEASVLDAPRTRELDQLTELAADRFGVPCSNVSLVDADRQWYASVVGPEMTENPRAVGFCAHTITQDRPLVVLDAAADRRFADNPAVTQGGVRFYAGAQVVVDGACIGTFCVMDTAPREAFTAEDEAELRAFAALVVAYAEGRKLASAKRADLAERLARERARIGEAARERARFVSLLSHELRTPLNAMIGFTDLLAEIGETLAPEERAAYLGEISGGSRRMQGVIESSLRFAATDTGDVTLSERDFRMDEAAVAGAATAAMAAKEKDARVTLDAEPGLPRLHADPVHCTQIVAQLVSNAVKYGPKGGQVRVRLSQAAGQVTVTVEDEGPGFHSLDADVLTTPFVGDEPIRSRRGEGLGLGLPLAYRLARLHGADIGFANAARGAVVTVTFPAYRTVAVHSVGEDARSRAA